MSDMQCISIKKTNAKNVISENKPSNYLIVSALPTNSIWKIVLIEALMEY
jgi:hypothetical protein